jgi:hypothetical protein
MSHQTISFLVQAKDLEEAQSHVNACLDSENSFFDGFEVIDKECAALEASRNRLAALLADNDYMKKAEGFLADANEYREKKNYSMAGWSYIRAGELFDERLSSDMDYYNLTDWNYQIPPDYSGWFFIPVDFHC